MDMGGDRGLWRGSQDRSSVDDELHAHCGPVRITPRPVQRVLFNF